MALLFIVGGILLSPLCHELIGLLGLGTMFLVSYSGMLGKALGVSWQGHGPLDKVERLFLLIICSILQYIGYTKSEPTVQWLGYNLSYLEMCMIVFFIFGQITVLRRVRGIYREDKLNQGI